MKQLITLWGGLLASSFALATTPSLVLTTSDNLIGQYSLSDSGVNTATGTNDLGWVNFAESTTARDLGIHQVGSQWFKTIEYTYQQSYDQSWQDYQYDVRSVSLSVNSGITGDQWFDLTLTTSSPMDFGFAAGGTFGSRTTPRGFTQLTVPSVGLVIDGVASSPSIDLTWTPRFNTNGRVNDTFQAVAEATDGGGISWLNVDLYANWIGGAVRTEHIVALQTTWTQDTEVIYAPVPEPETYAMLLAGLGLMGGIARRRKAHPAA